MPWLINALTTQRTRPRLTPVPAVASAVGALIVLAAAHARARRPPAGVGGGPVLCAAWCLQPRAWVVPWVGWLPGHGVKTLTSHDRECARAGRYFCTSRHHTQPMEKKSAHSTPTGAERRAHRPHGHGPLAPSRSVTCPLLRPSTRHALMAERVITCSCTHRHGKSVLVLHLCRRDHARRCLCVPAVA